MFWVSVLMLLQTKSSWNKKVRKSRSAIRFSPGRDRIGQGLSNLHKHLLSSKVLVLESGVFPGGSWCWSRNDFPSCLGKKCQSFAEGLCFEAGHKIITFRLCASIILAFSPFHSFRDKELQTHTVLSTTGWVLPLCSALGRSWCWEGYWYRKELRGRSSSHLH